MDAVLDGKVVKEEAVQRVFEAAKAETRQKYELFLIKGKSRMEALEATMRTDLPLSGALAALVFCARIGKEHLEDLKKKADEKHRGLINPAATFSIRSEIECELGLPKEAQIAALKAAQREGLGIIRIPYFNFDKQTLPEVLDVMNDVCDELIPMALILIGHPARCRAAHISDVSELSVVNLLRNERIPGSSQIYTQGQADKA